MLAAVCKNEWATDFTTEKEEKSKVIFLTDFPGAVNKHLSGWLKYKKEKKERKKNSVR